MPLWHRAPALQAQQDLQWDAQAQSWQMYGEEPIFVLGAPHPWPGWNMLELEAEGELMHGVASVCLEHRRGSYEIELPLRLGRTAKRLLYVPLGVRRLTLRLTRGQGAFRLLRLRFVWLTPRFAHDRLARRLSSLHPAYKGLSVRQVVRALHRESVARGCSWRRVAIAEHDRTHGNGHSYSQWIKRVESTRRTPGERPRGGDHRLPEQPLISLLMPLMWVGNEKEEAVVARLRDSLRSLQAQRYGNWELCLQLPSSIAPALATRIRQCLAQEARASVADGRTDSLAGLSHQAFIRASGAGILWLGLGDRLAEGALSQLVDAWQRCPQAQLFYADEDSLDAGGERTRPQFKPDWNPDLLLSCAYIGRPALYRRQLLWQLEDEDPVMPPAALASDRELDHAQALRFLAWWYRQTPELRQRAVCHLPRVLYHRRLASAARCDSPPEGASPSVALVQRWLARLPGAGGAVAEKGLVEGSVRVRWPIPSPAPLVSLLVPTRDGVEILRPCVDAILARTDYRHFELLILDNQSTCPETLAYMAEVQQRDARVRVLRWDHPFNYSAINNFGAEKARGEIIGLINNDVEPMDGEWLTEMVSQASRPEIGCVGAKLYYPNGIIQHGGVILGLGGVAGHAHRFFPRHDAGYCGRLKLVQNLSAVTAACLLLRRAVFEEVGGLNEADLAVAYNDVDLCLKVREAGYRNLWTPYAELYHHESVSRGEDNTPEKRARWLGEMNYMKRTWGEGLSQDPAYNPNLTLVYEDFSLR